MYHDAFPQSAHSVTGWTDWKWQMKNRIRTEEELRGWITPEPMEAEGIRRTKSYFRWRITPYYASLMDPSDPNCPIRRQVIPHADELDDDMDLLELDPLEEQAHSPVKNLIHNYRDRVAFCVTTECAVYCRYCLRKRMVGDGTQALNREELQEGIDYLADHPEIRDVLLTGGDPLSLNDDNLEWIIARLRAIPHISIIRIGTRYPVLNPFRVTDGLCRMLSRYHPVWLNTHFNHARELTGEAVAALDRLSHAGVPLGNQTVLLKGINDDVETLHALFHKLISCRVRPYYLYQAQLIGGTRHFRTTIEHGMALMEQLRGRLSGFAIPMYVLDTPHGKVPLTPTGFRKRDGDHVVVEAYDGTMWREYNPS
ncbi:KamA family radical SAM protein [Balneolales bacterium ANBcel1]|nr:KamA family radical SAM protein [Balneolales bacterium ANBcel1]